MRGEGIIIKALKNLWNDTKGDSLAVEAAILFPFLILLFSALVILAFYMPVQAELQRATQQAATAIATQMSDTWLIANSDGKVRVRTSGDPAPDNVYVSLVNSFRPYDVDIAEDIVRNIDNSNLISGSGTLNVICDVVNHVIYNEVIVTAIKEIPYPINLSLLGLPDKMIIAVTSTAVVNDSEEFIRNVDIIADVLNYFNIDVSKIGELFGAVRTVFGK